MEYPSGLPMKKFLSILLFLTLLICLIYYSAISEFKESKVIDHIYVYIDKGKFFKERYLAKYGEEIYVDISKSEFAIFLPYKYYYKTEWGHIDYTDNGIELLETYIKKNRSSIFFRYREGEDNRIQIFKFKTPKGNKGNIVFYRGIINEDGVEDVKKIILDVN